MTTPTIYDTDVKVSLDRLADRIDQARKLKREVAEANAFIAEVEKEVQDLILAADGTIGTIRNVPVFSLRKIESARWAQLIKNHAPLVEPYMELRMEPQLNKEKFKAEHPAIFAQYQSRMFRELPI